MADNKWENPSGFDPVDVSKPVKPRKEAEIIAEQKAAYRREWIRSHLTLIFTVVGVIVVALIFIVIQLFNQNTNPVNRLFSSIAKDVSEPFDFTVTVSKDDQAVMSFVGSLDIDSDEHSVRMVYDADYTDYSYKGVVYADSGSSVKGYYYKDKWTIRNDEEQIANFLDFNTDLRRASFDSGAFLRFTELTSKYSADELDRFVALLKDRLSADSEVASISSSKVENGTEYRYDIDLIAVFDLINTEGASVFCSADDYNKFREKYDLNEDNIRDSELTMIYTVDTSGYMTDLSIRLKTPQHSYSISCVVSNFNMAVTRIPADFLETATVNPSEKQR